MKKGELSINIIIVAAIALLILVIIAVLLFRSGGDINQGTQTCEGIGGQCMGSCADLATGDGTVWAPNPSKACTNEGDICCMPLGR